MFRNNRNKSHTNFIVSIRLLYINSVTKKKVKIVWKKKKLIKRWYNYLLFNLLYIVKYCD